MWECISEQQCISFSVKTEVGFKLYIVLFNFQCRFFYNLATFQLLIILLITWPSELRLLLTQYCTSYINLKGDFKQTKLCTDGSFSWVEFVDFRMTCIKNLKKLSSNKN